MAEVRRLNRGESERLRIGYIASAVQEYLGPALAVLRRAYPRLKVKMLDQTPGEMIIALRQGKIDLNVVMVPIADAGATWDLFIVWQRGKIASPLRTLLSELNLKSQ